VGSATTLEKHGLNNLKVASDLAEAVKQTLCEDYLQAYSENRRMIKLMLLSLEPYNRK
jgi:hypothetical protein